MSSESLDAPVLEVRRPFDWGIVTVVDAESTDDWPTLEWGRPYVAGASVLTVVVRHAQDTPVGLSSLRPDEEIPPFEVRLRCWVDAVPTRSPTLEVQLDVPSGRIEIGDAERWDPIQLQPGGWSVSAILTPVDHPETVDLWLRQVSA